MYMIFCLIFQTAFALTPIHVDLNDNWTFSQTENQTYSGPAIVPGDIYQDLQSNGLISDPLIGDNDKALRWIGRTNWTYSCTLTITADILQRKSVLLNIQGLDTIATVGILSNHSLIAVAETINQFDQQMVDVKPYLYGGENLLRIDFQSPVEYANRVANDYEAKYGHELPPSCPPDEYSGECHFNFIRKIASSFSWDWGPSFPTVGIWQPISLEAFDFAHINQIGAQVIKNGENFNVLVDLVIYSAITAGNVRGSVSFDELSVNQEFTVTLTVGYGNRITINVTVPGDSVQLWWPNGYGHHPLYAMNVVLNCPDGSEQVWKNGTNIGFRTIELVQDYIDATNKTIGRYFYFKVNGVPVFLKGSNWIPLSTFPAQMDNDRMDYLLRSASAANMNTLRVWGGGRYESDHFYDMADQLGILLWQDLMFACAAYPIVPDFMANVDRELTVQLNRIKHHPSILLWAGNNENEVAIRTEWWHPANFNKSQMIHEYGQLFKDHIKPMVESIDRSRPFLISSPSNGIESELSPDAVAEDPSSQFYGDVHYYTEDKDLWASGSFPTPRCATEYGVQSIPHRRTLERSIPNPDSLTYGHTQFVNRQHHPNGNANLLKMIYSHFNIPEECNGYDWTNIINCTYVNTSKSFLDRFIYLTQMHQAIAYQTETEHYMRTRSKVFQDATGSAMCALYWQLNDLWAAPTWSSIDFDLNWKASHYFAKRFFAPIIASTFIDGSGTLRLFVVNDQREQLNAQFVYEAFNCKASCISLTGELRFDMTVAGLSAMEIVDPTYLRSVVLGDTVAIDVYENLVDRSRIVNSSTGAVIYETVRLGRKVIQAADRDLGTVAIGTVTGSGYQYEIELIANGFAPLIWLDLSESLPGWFNDNAFTLLDGRRTVMFTLDRLINRTLTAHDFTVCSLKDCGMVTTTGTTTTTNAQTDSSTSSAHNPIPTSSTAHTLLPTSGTLTLTVLFLRFCS